MLLVPLLLLAACAGPGPGGLTAVLTAPTDVYLTWNPDPGAAGQTVEYADDPDGEYTVLHYAQPGENSYEHPDLVPETRCYYRVRPYFGPASEPVEVALPPGDDVPAEDSHGWAEPRKGRPGGHPVRSPDAAPAGLRAQARHANGILFSWTDRAVGEDGYLLEARPAGAGEYSVVATLDPDVTSFGLVTLPSEKRASYRVRAFHRGPPTTVAYQKTLA
ncbi:fibronectin type III domain-containing protein [Actinosynnema sp. NPDC047251]|uniref:fibronectin type III domain-containing protein n=1 Tax=Saccharothrix espanaensis TaxID=103731 RepID=UPI0002F61AA6|nr:fibronectin type III domain-containing protein [Saccharothrix espanaensis]